MNTNILAAHFLFKCTLKRICYTLAVQRFESFFRVGLRVYSQVSGALWSRIFGLIQSKIQLTFLATLFTPRISDKKRSISPEFHDTQKKQRNLLKKLFFSSSLIYIRKSNIIPAQYQNLYTSKIMYTNSQAYSKTIARKIACN